MNTSRAWVIYTIVRVLAFIVPFAIIMLVLPGWQWNWLVGLVVATIVNLSVTEIFLHEHRTMIAKSFQDRQEARERGRIDTRRPIDVEEDEILDAQEAEAAGRDDAAGTPAPETSGGDVPDKGSPADADEGRERSDAPEHGAERNPDGGKRD
ncbi:DUF4229 domain-containing protein [Gulosibacter sp. 10]|uniref:DUF4229 domain-containing protein n=1 Tax=Gulosibacter sp. 10 TaxID=1255570 RepID=UPI00097F0ABE|nr:DUF4229 domain-containing protein [Gulosibacter sp. 10]SJM55996.1 hypothetical protein FM112_04430 [Gulosibacter sp. 10]